MSAIAAYILFAISTTAAPSLTPLATFEDLVACKTAATSITAALATGEDPKIVICISSDSLQQLAAANPA